ncbi:hypothetical protein [Paenibacillus odorifer]|nr:hypothetical protein [Paenibacillus odorifer]
MASLLPGRLWGLALLDIPDPGPFSERYPFWTIRAECRMDI